MDEGLRRLAATIIHTAVLDWRRTRNAQGRVAVPKAKGVFVHRKEVVEFFNSTWFDSLADILGLDAENILRQL